MGIERTLSIIKPNAVEDNNIGNIVARFEKEGLKIAGMKLLSLSKEKAEGFYIEHKQKPFFGSLVNFMTSGPIIVMVLEGDDVVNRNREIMGATNPADADDGTLRKLYARSLQENAVHGSDSLMSAEREVSYFFEKHEMSSRFDGRNS